MPHVVIEYSEAEIDDGAIGALMQAAFEVCASSGIMQKGDVKVRALPLRHLLLQDGARGFVHLTVSMLAGRTAAQKAALAEALRARLAGMLAHIDLLSIDIRDMDPVAYKKRVLGP